MRGSIAVLGDRGYVGRAVVRAATARGWTVLPLPTPSGERLELSRASRALTNLADQADVIVNCAGRAHLRSSDTRAFWAGNVESARTVAEAAGRSGRTALLIHVSSVAVGAAGVSPVAGPQPPPTAYGMSKAVGELLVDSTARRYGLDLTVVRPAGIYGRHAPGDWGRVWRLVEAGRPVPVPAGGGVHDVVSIDAVASFLLDCAERTVDPGVYNLTGRRPVTLREYVEHVAAATGTRARVVEVPVGIVRTAVRATNVVASTATRLQGLRQAAKTLSEPADVLGKGPGLVRRGRPQDDHEPRS